MYCIRRYSSFRRFTTALQLYTRCTVSFTAKKVCRPLVGSLLPYSHFCHPVAFGTICQLILSNAPSSELDKFIAFNLSIDLPVTFEQLGVPNVTDEQLKEVAGLACQPGETIWSMETTVNEELVFGAIKGADAAGRSYIKRTGWKKE